MHKSKAALFLMEILIALLFFSIAGAVCLQLFSSAHITNTHSNDMSNANILLTNTAESFYSDSLNNIIANDTDNTYYYDSHLVICDASSARYTVICSISTDNSMTTNHIKICTVPSETILLEQDIIRYERMVKP